MDQLLPTPQTARALIEQLHDAQSYLAKGGRRVAKFIVENPGAAALYSCSEVAQRCGVHASSVVRLVQSLGFAGYREFQAVLQEHFANPAPERRSGKSSLARAQNLRLHLFADSGRSFNESAEAAARQFCLQNPSVQIESQSFVSHAIDAEEFAEKVVSVAGPSDGVIVVAREHPATNDAVRTLMARGVPVICLTTDLPSSGRTAYVGSDQVASGSTAAWFCGRMLPRNEPGRVLFVCSVPFRCHSDREQGFRQVLRSEFPLLTIDEKVSSDESPDVIYEAVRRYISKNGPPAAIYNVSGANLGVGRALEDEGLSDSIVFVGHELNVNSRSLLERGVMDLAIGHDFEREIALAVECVEMARKGILPVNRFTQSQLFTRFNCAIF